MTETRRATTATAIWRVTLRDVIENGAPVEQDSAGAEWRGRTSYELLAYRTVWPMDRAVVGCPARKLGYRFLAAESAWILSGSNRLADIASFAPSLAKLSDDGEFLSGAYGPPYHQQLPYIVQALARDPASRQAVATIWRPYPGQLKDISCTIALQWLIRSGTIHCVATMRSSDLWLGLPYDAHAFSMASVHVALHLRDRLGPLALGDLYLTAGSAHVYKLDVERARECAERDDELYDDIAPLDLADFASPADLVAHLWAISRRDRDSLRSGYLLETLP